MTVQALHLSNSLKYLIFFEKLFEIEKWKQIKVYRDKNFKYIENFTFSIAMLSLLVAIL